MNRWIMLAAILAVAGLSGCGNDGTEVEANAPAAVGQAETSTGNTEAEELPDSQLSSELQYPLAEFEYASYEVSIVGDQH